MLKKKEIALVYMVAGISSRFGGKIKQFANVGPNGETLIEYSMKQALKSDFSKVIFIVGKMTEKPFKEKFGNNLGNIPILYAMQDYDEKQRDRPWGTTDALCSMHEIIDCPFIICNGDDLYGEESFKLLFEHLQNSDESAIPGWKLCDVVPQEGKTNRAIIKTENNLVKEVKEMFNVEKNRLDEQGLALDNLCSMNIFAFQKEIVAHLKKNLEDFKSKHSTDRKIECLLPEEVNKLIKDGKMKLVCYETEGMWKGITNPADEEKLRKELANTQNK